MWFIQEHKNLNLRKQFCLKGKGYLAAVLRWRDTTLCLCLLSTVSFNAPFGQSLQPVSPPLPPLFTPKCPTQNLTPDSQICYSVSGARANNSACVNIRNLLIAGSHPSLRSVSSLNTIFINISSRQPRPAESLANKRKSGRHHFSFYCQTLLAKITGFMAATRHHDIQVLGGSRKPDICLRFITFFNVL